MYIEIDFLFKFLMHEFVWICCLKICDIGQSLIFHVYFYLSGESPRGLLVSRPMTNVWYASTAVIPSRLPSNQTAFLQSFEQQNVQQSQIFVIQNFEPADYRVSDSYGSQKSLWRTLAKVKIYQKIIVLTKEGFLGKDKKHF